MKLGWILTFLLHGGLLLAAMVSFSSVKELKVDDVKPVEVEIISVADIEQVGKKKTKDLTTKKAKKQPIKKPTKVTKPTKKPQVKPKVKPKPKAKPKTVAKAIPVVPKSLDALIENVSKPEPSPTEPQKTEAQPLRNVTKPVKRPAYPKPKKVETKPKTVAPAKPTEDQLISALLDKLDKEQTALPDTNDGELGTVNGELENVEVASLSQYEFNAVKNRMASCWSIPAGAQDAGDVVVKVGFRLNRNAQVIGRPSVLNNSAHPSFNIMSEAAVRAILECGPYDMLPPEKFDVWSEFTMEFDPREMFGG